MYWKEMKYLLIEAISHSCELKENEQQRLLMSKIPNKLTFFFPFLYFEQGSTTQTDRSIISGKGLLSISLASYLVGLVVHLESGDRPLSFFFHCMLAEKRALLSGVRVILNILWQGYAMKYISSLSGRNVTYRRFYFSALVKPDYLPILSYTR